MPQKDSLDNFGYTSVFRTLSTPPPNFQHPSSLYTTSSICKSLFGLYLSVVQANGIEDHSFVKEMDYQEVLNSQEIFGDELAMFAKKELQKEVGRLTTGLPDT